MKVKNPNYIMPFGKNEGETLATIYKYQPSYLEFLIENVNDFKIDISVFESLPKPTPPYYNAGAFKSEPEREFIDIRDISTEDLINSLVDSDQINPSLKVGEIKGNKYEPIDYKFPERIRKINDSK